MISRQKLGGLTHSLRSLHEIHTSRALAGSCDSVEDTTFLTYAFQVDFNSVFFLIFLVSCFKKFCNTRNCLLSDDSTYRMHFDCQSNGVHVLYLEIQFSCESRTRR